MNPVDNICSNIFTVTGFPIMLSTLLMGICGIFYTSIGGIKAVVWTDFIQGLMMYVGTSVILIKVLFINLN